MQVIREGRFGWALTGLLSLQSAALAQPQCSFAIAPGDALAGANGPVRVCKPWDPDGPGPAPRHIVVGGEFRVAGNVSSPFLAAYEPGARQWVGFNPSLPGSCAAVATGPNGRLVAYASPIGVFEWTGSTWQQLGPNFGNQVSALAIMANGDVVAGGVFLSIGSAPIHGIARWDGTAWQPMGAPVSPLPFLPLGTVNHIEQLPNGDLVATGLFQQIGGVPCSFIARWNGSIWGPLGGGSTAGAVSVAITTAGDIIASNGTFATPTGPASFARWSGTDWIDIGAGLPITSGTLVASSNGGVLALNASGIWEWDGTVWSQLPSSGPIFTSACAIAADDFLFGGSFAPTTAVPSRNVARWSGSVWQPIPSAAVGRIRNTITRPDGEVVLVGEFANGQGGIDPVMTWRAGGPVTALQPGVWGTRNVRNVSLAANGDVLMAYSDSGLNGGGIARYDGTTVTFASLVGAGPNALLELPNGDVLVAGLFASSPYSLMRWDGTQLTPFGALLPGVVVALAAAPNGDIIAGGGFTTPGRIARWDGTAWQSFGPGLTHAVTSLVTLPDGDVIACQRIQSVLNTQVMHWNGTAWTQLGETVGQADVVWSATGTAALFGELTELGGAPNAYFARLQPTCPAGVLDRGGGCVGAAGQVTLSVIDRAWLGGALRTRANGLPPGSLSIGVYGSMAQSVPLAQLHPRGAPGCNLLTTDDILLQFSVVGGRATPVVAVPNALALVGTTFQHQLIGVEVDAAGSVSAVTGSNALQHTFGAL